MESIAHSAVGLESPGLMLRKRLKRKLLKRRASDGLSRGFAVDPALAVDKAFLRGVGIFPRIYLKPAQTTYRHSYFTAVWRFYNVID